MAGDGDGDGDGDGGGGGDGEGDGDGGDGDGDGDGFGSIGGAGRLGVVLADTQLPSTSDEMDPPLMVHDWLATWPKHVRVAICPVDNRVRHHPFMEERISPVASGGKVTEA